MAASQSNYFKIGSKTKKVGSAAPVIVICALYVYIASVQTYASAKSENTIDVTYEVTPTL